MDDLIENKLQTAYELIKAGQRDQACKILIPLVRANPALADGWFLLGHAASQPQEKIRCFRQVLRLEPDNQAAQKQLARLVPPKKKSPVNLWGLAGLAGLLICVVGLVFLWGLNNPLSASPAATVPGSATPILPTLTLVASTSRPESSQPPKPTSRPTITLPPTSTPQPSVTILPTPTLTFTKTPIPTPSPQPKVLTGCMAPNGLGELTAPFKIENFGKEQAVVYINGISRNGNYPIYCRKTVRQGLPVIFTLMWGDYEYIIMRGSITRRGSFFINQPNKATMRIFKDKIQIGEFP